MTALYLVVLRKGLYQISLNLHLVSTRILIIVSLIMNAGLGLQAALVVCILSC